jgi:hypothetical protein
MGETLMAGAARSDITPPLGSLLVGYADPNRFAESVRDPLNATAVVLERGETLVAIVSLDWSVIENETVAEVRAAVAKLIPIKPENVTISVTHTHSGPATFNVFGWANIDRTYMDMAVPKIADAVRRAYESRRPARIGIGTTQSDVGVNRREIEPAPDHTIKLGVNPWGPYDPTMTVIRVVEEHHWKGIATIVHYGAHATSFDGTTKIVTRDWPGVMCDRVEQLTGGAPVLFINGALGDVGPRMANNKTVGDGESSMLEVGLRAAGDAMRAYRSIHHCEDVTLQTHTSTIDIPYAPLATLKRAQRALARMANHGKTPGPVLAEILHWEAVIEAHSKPPVTSRPFRQTVTRIGSAVIVPIPGEAFAEIVLRIRQESPFDHTLAASVCNGSHGYFVTREARARGGYEVWVAMAFGPQIPADNVDDWLVTSNSLLLRILSLNESAEASGAR